MKFLQVFKRELRQLFLKDSKRACYLFGASVVYVVLFGLLYMTGVVNYVPMVVYDQDQTQLSRSLIQAYEDSDRYEVVAYVTSQEEMESYLQNKTAFAALAIPPDFARDIKLGRASRILLEANGANIIIANTIMSSAQEIMMEFSASVGKSLVETIGQLPDQSLNRAAPIDFRLRVLNNPILSYLEFFVLGVAMAALQQGILLSVGSSMTNENFEEFRDTKPVVMLLGKLIPYWLGGILSYVMALLIAVQGFGIPCRGSFISLVLIGAVFAATVAVMGSLMALICKDEVGFTQLSLSYTVPAFIYSGYTWPLHAMDSLSTALASVFPITYMAGNVRDIMLAGYAPMFYGDVFTLLAAGLVLFIIALRLYSRKAKLRISRDQTAVV
ncbi:MAG: ABC transporter permease [Veillonellaceae bacterium]|jgi:ABC-2 type transport system permease protein|nr:ABC transporter permease [Veillonellaceae bacterium]